MAGYPKLAEAAVPPKEATQIAELLNDPSIYLRQDEGWTCIFEPGHVARFESEKGAVDVVICFKCGDVEMHPSPAVAEPVFFHGLNGEGKSRLYEVISRSLPGS